MLKPAVPQAFAPLSACPSRPVPWRVVETAVNAVFTPPLLSAPGASPRAYGVDWRRTRERDVKPRSGGHRTAMSRYLASPANGVPPNSPPVFSTAVKRPAVTGADVD